ncbi:hypothetical protein DY000_02061793 [Brassica cretica]|uniref:Endonuclease/exonuclease/phosphatase domain-containing protein n=1 Tax=Brassica cretica TaxID=69181 RepID=A0ABQ7AMM7_BRACR|nr:hypothetical protein DY000_02061793 [Brassica cretica]
MDEANLAIQEADLFVAHSKGLLFTWWNNQDDNPISKKIDHVLIIEQWALQFPDSFSEFLEPLQSDHPPVSFVCHLCKGELLSRLSPLSFSSQSSGI